MQRINREEFAELAISSSVGAEGVSDRFRTSAKDFVKTAIGFDGTWELEETMDPAACRCQDLNWRNPLCNCPRGDGRQSLGLRKSARGFASKVARLWQVLSFLRGFFEYLIVF